MKVRIGHFGRIAKKELLDVGLDFQKRCARYIQIEDFEYSTTIVGHDKRTPGRAKESVLRSETTDYLVLLDEHGKSLSTLQFTDFIKSTCEDTRYKRLIFVVGPPYGFDDATKKSANLLLSLGPFVIPSDFAWLIVSEQIYRAFNILNNGKYHHA
jgi:23S rRNA (pseudouridine1915-N3)-methyltransferase